MHFCFALASIVAVVLVASSSARAESGPPPDSGPACAYGSTPVDPVEGDVPANWPRFRIEIAGYEVDTSSVRLVRVADGTEVPSEIRGGRGYTFIVVYPLTDLVLGESYDLYHPTCPGREPRITHYRATAPLATPASLGEITVSDLLAANRTRGASNRIYFVSVSLRADPMWDRDPWTPGLLWGVDVDGARAGDPSELYTRVVVPVDCGSGSGILPGDHSFIGVSWTPLDRIRASTAEVMAATGACDSARRVDVDSLEPLTPDQIAFWDSVPMDAGPPDELDAGPHDGGATTHDDSGCTISPATSRAPVPWLLLLVGYVGYVARLHRRHRSLPCLSVVRGDSEDDQEEEAHRGAGHAGACG